MDKEYLINGKPWSAILKFALPMIIGNLFQQLYTMADSVVVGRYVSENALAAVGASYSLTNVFIAVAIGGGIGASVMVSRYFGARKYDKMKNSVYTALISFLIVSVALAVFGFFAGKDIMILLNTPENTIDLAAEYLQIYFLGMPFLFMYNVLSSMFNALGKSKIPLYLLIFSSVFNVALDVFMVKNLGMGVSGVAWATFIAQGISAALAYFIFMREMKTFSEKPKKIYDGREFNLMLRIALPSILQQSTVFIGLMLMQAVVNGFGSEALAGFSAAARIEGICVVPMAAMCNAMSSYTAQNLGAGKELRVVQGYHLSFGIVGVFAIAICVVLEVFNVQIISLFLGNDGTTVALETGVRYLQFMGWFFVLIGMKMITDGVLRGAGDMPVFTIANLVNLGFRVAFAAICAPIFGIDMVWFAVPIGWAINFIISYAEYKTGKWKNIKKMKEATA